MREIILTSAVESVTLSESFIGRIRDSLRLPPAKYLFHEQEQLQLFSELPQLQYFITAIFTGATQVTDWFIFT